jgi:hypothetical protein
MEKEIIFLGVETLDFDTATHHTLPSTSAAANFGFAVSELESVAL